MVTKPERKVVIRGRPLLLETRDHFIAVLDADDREALTTLKPGLSEHEQKLALEFFVEGRFFGRREGRNEIRARLEMLLEYEKNI